jgi:tetratricopeptide (TPR) repeat protein
MAFAYFMENQLQDAEVAASNSLEEAERAGLSSQPVVLTPLKVLGDIYSQKNELDKATDTYEKLYNIVEPRKYQSAQEFEYAAAWLGDVYRRQDKLDYAERYYRQALEMARTTTGNQKNLFTAKVLYGLGLVLEKENNNKEAEQCFREALPMAKELAGQRSAIAGAIKKHLVDVLWRTNWISAIMTRVNSDNNNNNDQNNQGGPPPNQNQGNGM